MEEKKSSINIGTKSFLSTVLILLAIMIFAGVLTQVLPQGSFEREIDAETGQEMVIPGTYEIEEDVETLPVWRWFTAPFEVLFQSDAITAIVIIIFIILIGGTFTVLESGGVFTYVIGVTIRKFGDKKYMLMAAISFIFMFMGSTMGLLEEVVPLIPLIVSLAIALKWDALVGLGMSLLSVGFGFAAGTFNPFTIVIAQELAGLELYSGLGFRIGVFVIIYTILIIFLTKYGKKIEKSPEKSLVYGIHSSVDNFEMEEHIDDPKVRKATMVFGISLSIVFAYIILSLLVSGLSDYTMPVMAIVLTVGGLISGKMVVDKTMKTFLKGMIAISPCALLIIMALSVKLIIVEGGILDTILQYAYQMFQNTSSYGAIIMIYLLVLSLQFFISGAASKAFLIMPIIVPLGDMVGLTRQSVVQVFCFADGFTNVFFPTCALMLISLGLVNVPMSKWLKWTWKLQAVILIVTMLLSLGMVAIGYN